MKMLKKVTVSVTFLLGTILMLCADVLCGGCPSGTIRIGNICYKWHGETKMSWHNAATACFRDGGRLAGYNGDFFETLQENTILKDYLPKENCHWVHLSSIYNRRPDYSFFYSIMPKTLQSIMDFALAGYYRPCVFFRGGKWIAGDVGSERQNNFLCEYDVSIPKKVRRPPDVKMKVVRMTRVSAFIADQSLFVDRAPVPTMCSRLCQGFRGCSVFNYNKVTKQCRGFGEMENTGISYHQDWELWEFE